MSEYVYSIDKETYERDYSSANVLGSLSSKEDIATLVDTLEQSGIIACNIIKILDMSGKYVFVVDSSYSSFDFFMELNKMSTLGTVLSPLNIKLLYPKTISRGYFLKSEVQDDLSDTGEIADESDETSTGFLDADDLQELRVPQKVVSRRLYHKNAEVRLPVDDHGIIIGRSSSQSEYVVSRKVVSRRHARVYKRGDKYWVHDYESANGTYIDGLKVSDDDRELMPGSVLTLADEEFVLE